MKVHVISVCGLLYQTTKGGLQGVKKANVQGGYQEFALKTFTQRLCKSASSNSFHGRLPSSSHCMFSGNKSCYPFLCSLSLQVRKLLVEP